jgi:glutathione S-transferase
LAHLGVDYERVPVDIFAGETMTADYATKNPALTTPVLELPSGEYLAESNAILLHLSEGTDFLPAEQLDRAQVYRWLFFEQGAVLPTVADLRFRLLTGRIDAQSEEAARLKRVSQAVLGVVESRLAERQFMVADRFTVADIALFGYIHVAHEADVAMDHYQSIGNWLERVRNQPGHVEDVAPYPENARPGKGRSIHDLRFS